MSPKELSLYTISVICLTDPTVSFKRVEEIGTTLLSRLGFSRAERASFFLWLGYGYAAFTNGAHLHLHSTLVTQMQE